ncbi:MAG: hypothetical protein ACR2MP_06870 [Streptosporangiaceae bacterium]
MDRLRDLDGWFDTVYPVYAGDRVGATTEQTFGVALHLRCAPAEHLALLLNREKTMTEHPAMAALNSPERQLAAAFGVPVTTAPGSTFSRPVC